MGSVSLESPTHRLDGVNGAAVVVAIHNVETDEAAPFRVMQYMSPEQARGDSVDARSDLFSLGSVLYAMAAGRSPFRAESSYAILRRIIDEQPRPVREVNAVVPVWLEAIVKKLHAKSPDDRFQSAEEVAEVLGKCLAHVQQPTVAELPPECRSSPHSMPSRRRRYSIIVGCMNAVAVFVGLIALPILREGEDPAESGTASDATASTGTAEPAATRAAASRRDPSTLELPTPDVDLNWNAVADDLKSVDEELGPFGIRTRQLWDNVPQPYPTQPDAQGRRPDTSSAGGDSRR